MPSPPLPEHPQERRLRRAELDLADAIRTRARKVTATLRRHDRITAAVELTALRDTCEAARHATITALDDVTGGRTADLIRGHLDEETDL